MSRPLALTTTDRGLRASFSAMASPCEILLNGSTETEASYLAGLVRDETVRIEQKFSRYRDDNIIHRINHAGGNPVNVDNETAQLLDFAQICYQLSHGLFDITSGVLRRIWRFDGSGQLPTQREVDDVMQFVGWEKIRWQRPALILQKGMEIDLGGIGKEYAVDRAAELLKLQTNYPFLLNFGGDLRVSGPQENDIPWRIGVENPEMQTVASQHIQLAGGALATSGDSRRFIMSGGKRYSHILNPRTGWPVENAPRSVTVAAATALEAGMLSTFASLQGANAESFLQAQKVPHWILW